MRLSLAVDVLNQQRVEDDDFCLCQRLRGA